MNGEIETGVSPINSGNGNSPEHSGNRAENVATYRTELHRLTLIHGVTNEKRNELISKGLDELKNRFVMGLEDGSITSEEAGKILEKFAEMYLET